VIADGALQEAQMEDGSEAGGWHPMAAALRQAGLSIPKLVPAAPPQGDANALREAARMLARAENPVILADRAVRTPAGVQLMVQLAEALGAPVVDLGGRMNMPNNHYANLSGMRGSLIRQADVILALEVGDLWGMLNSVGDAMHEYRRVAKANVKVIHINLNDMVTKSNYQDFERFTSVDLPITGDVEATLPALIEAIRREAGSSNVAARTETMKDDFRVQQRNVRTQASYGWDASPITTARLAAETWNVVKDENWALSDGGLNGWTRRLWTITEFGQMLGGSGGSGVGYSSPASIGAALANKAKGKITINFQPDGDLMYAPGVMWTAAHHNIPLLRIMFNNRGYHQEMMHLQRMASVHGRDATTAPIGTAINDPDIDYAKLAESMGWWSTGPITDPGDLNGAITRALAVVKSGSPALVDVVCQPR
jgi:acetolactate synthase-1/2/3 large subunit